jgi:hypothetical protein
MPIIKRKTWRTTVFDVQHWYCRLGWSRDGLLSCVHCVEVVVSWAASCVHCVEVVVSWAVNCMHCVEVVVSWAVSCVHCVEVVVSWAVSCVHCVEVVVRTIIIIIIIIIIIPSLLYNRYRGSFPRVKRTEREADHSSSSSEAFP